MVQSKVLVMLFLFRVYEIKSSMPIDDMFVLSFIFIILYIHTFNVKNVLFAHLVFNVYML